MVAAPGFAAAPESKSEQAAPAPSTAPKARAGKEILDTTCVACHDVSVVTTRPAADWPAVLDRMGNNGMNLSAADRKSIEAYLIANYSTGDSR